MNTGCDTSWYRADDYIPRCWKCGKTVPPENDPGRAVDGDYTASWKSKVGSAPCASAWLYVRLADVSEAHQSAPPYTGVYVRSVRVHVNQTNLEALFDAEIRVGNQESSPTSNTQCATISNVTNVTTVVPGGHAYITLECYAAGRYVFLYQPRPACLEVLELEVVGRRTGCTSCAKGEYQDVTGSTHCKSCAWGWQSDHGATSEESSTALDDCTCDAGFTGTNVGVSQDTPSHRPVYMSTSGMLGQGGIKFDRGAVQFLHSRDRTWNIASNGGLTVAVEVKYSGLAGMNERIVDFGSTLERYHDSFLLSRWQDSDQLYAAITEKVHIASLALLLRFVRADMTTQTLTPPQIHVITCQAMEVCQIWSEPGTIVQEEWMYIIFQYDSSNNTMILRKNGRIVGGPTVCSGTPSDRATSNESYVGKSRFLEDATFHGEMSGLVVADETVRNLAQNCSPACLVLQSSTWTPDSGTQHYRDQKISQVNSLEGFAIKAVDGSADTCSQSWRETSPWWRVDLEAPRLVVSVRVLGQVGYQAELEDFEIRVGNWESWGNNPVCAADGTAMGDEGWIDVMCRAEGRYVFVILPGTNRSLGLCEVEIHGMPNAATSTVISGLVTNCTSCQPGVCFSLLLCSVRSL